MFLLFVLYCGFKKTDKWCTLEGAWLFALQEHVQKEAPELKCRSVRYLQAGAPWVGAEVSIHTLYFCSDTVAFSFLFQIICFTIYILKRPVL